MRFRLRFSCLLLCLCLSLSLQTVAFGEPLTDCTLAVSSATALPGETVTLSLTVDAAHPIASFDLTLQYDPAVLEILEIRPGDVVINAPVRASNPSVVAGIARLSFAEIQPKKSQGTLWTVQARVLEDAAEGDSLVRFVTNDSFVYYMTGLTADTVREFEVGFVDGGITVTAERQPTPLEQAIQALPEAEAILPTDAEAVRAACTLYRESPEDRALLSQELHARLEAARQAVNARFGDVNNDRTVNASDALLALQHSVRLTVLTDAPLLAADVDGNETVNSVDALMMLQLSVRLINTLPVMIPALDA